MNLSSMCIPQHSIYLKHLCISTDNISLSCWRSFAVKAILLWAVICLPGNIYSGVLFYSYHQNSDDNGYTNTTYSENGSAFDVENTHQLHNFAECNAMGHLEDVEHNAIEERMSGGFTNETELVRIFVRKFLDLSFINISALNL